ncbi:MAG TPA: ComEC/Rec2 family competence protein, partial [Ruminococcus flavefaciens]|nr:ComEC/Rec2 family competence protein [Ruminococcus flavefaciens]
MKRKMIGAAAAYMSGSFFASFFNDVRAWLIGAAAVAMVLIFGGKRGWKRTDSLLLGIAFTVGIALYSAYTAVSYKPVVAYDGTDGSFTGSITEITRYDGNRAGYVLKGRINGVTDAKITYFGYDPDARYGDTVSIEKCTFRKPSNDYIFNSELYYKADGIFLAAASAENVRITHTHTRFIRNKLADFRSYMTERLKAETDEDAGGFLAGMIFGEKRELDSEIKTSLYRSGIGHILAVSGLHVSIIAILLMSVLRKANVNRFISYGIMNVMLISFVAMANYPVSAIRAAIMMDLFHGARLIHRQNNSLNSLAIASLIILTAQPYAIFDAGFLLSVSGTFGIAVFAPFMTKNMK